MVKRKKNVWQSNDALVAENLPVLMEGQAKLISRMDLLENQAKGKAPLPPPPRLSKDDKAIAKK